jgi:hypothetical protein
LKGHRRLIVVFDASALLLTLQPGTSAPVDPNSGSPLTFAKERIDHLIDLIAKKSGQVIIPTPALSEILVHAGPQAAKIIEVVGRRRVMRIAPFDALAAIEAATMMYERKQRTGSLGPNKTKIKFDCQIVAIAKTIPGVQQIVTGDHDIKSWCVDSPILVRQLYDLDLPVTDLQGELSV